METTVVVADDHPLMLEALVSTLRKAKFCVVSQENDGDKALDTIFRLDPDIALVDLKMPGKTGIDIAKALNGKAVSTRIVLLSYHLEPILIDRASTLGIAGYVLKESTPEVLIEALRTVANGQSFFDPRVRKVATEVLHPIRKVLRTLTPTEKKILQLVAKGVSTREIASQAFVSTRTIEKHRANIAAKLENIRDGESLADWARKNKEVMKE